MNSVDQECFEIVKAPRKCPILGESNPDINYWVKGDGCCEVKNEESELCDPVDDDSVKKTTTKQTTKPTTKPTEKPKTKPSTNDVDSGLLQVFTIECKNYNLLTSKTGKKVGRVGQAVPTKIQAAGIYLM